MHRRLLMLAEFVTPPDVKPTLVYLERRAKLKPGSLKDSAKRGSMSKAVAALLLDAAPRLGIAGLTAEWIHYERGPIPYKGGEASPDGGSGSGPEAGEPDEDTAYLAYTLEALRALSTLEREDVSVGIKLLMLEEIEKRGVEKFGQRAKEFTQRIRGRIRSGGPLGPGGA